MEYLVGIVIGLAIAWLLPLERLKLGRQPQQAPPVAKPANEPSAAKPAASAAAEPEPLAARLHKLESVFEPVASNSAHPSELSEQPQFCQAVELLSNADVPLEIVLQYALGANWTLSCAGLAALAKRSDRADALDQILAYYDKLVPWAMHFALEYFLTLEQRPPLGAPLINAKEWWQDSAIVLRLFREHLVRREHLGDEPTFGSTLSNASSASIAIIRGFLQRLKHPLATALIQHLDSIQRTMIDRAFLTSFGRFWSEGKALDFLIEPEAWRETLADAEATVREAPVRSLLASGDHGTGKTTFFKLLAKRLEGEGWMVFEASGADLMAGQKWFGELEGRIQRTVEELAVSKKVIWYIPDILQIALSGTHQGQAASILEQILPAIAAGRLIVWGEALPDSTTRLLRRHPALRSHFEAVRLEPLSEEETLSLANAWGSRVAGEEGMTIDPVCVETAMHAARQYLSNACFPGSVLDLLKLTVARAAKSEGETIKASNVIQTLSQLTGLPVSILNSKERVDLAAIRQYFAERVIGQEEAIAAIVDRIAMLKAGLNDLGKPIGVFLFAGPTGTGKTELAKTLAEYLFGSIDRLIRLDMSEFQTPESTMKILGGGDYQGSTDSLITRIRKQPFSVVLLDELEKAHANVWDLFLQVFDDGRLTDSLGHVADFRHCIIILTTNLGATSHQGSGLGFVPAANAFSSEQIMRAVSQTFRPEFQNRLDKVIVFHPLTRDLMRGILQKELRSVLQRRGFKDREWAVEWEASALEFLLEKGFSPEMGARPLKRAIDQYVIAPLAATIVEKRFPEGDQFVFVRSDGRAIQAEFVDPDSDAAKEALVPAVPAAPDKQLLLPAMILAAKGTEAELKALDAAYSGIQQSLASAEWEDLKASLSDAMQAANFWRKPERYAVLARLALMDRVKAAAGTAESLRARLAKGTERAGKSSRELVGRLALQLHLVQEGVKDVFEAAPVEAALMVERAFDTEEDGQATRQWCLQLLDMYRAWANNRHMQLTELAGERARDLPLLLISGFGAYRLLAREMGLHVLEFPDNQNGAERITARVKVAAAPLGDLPASKWRLSLKDAFEQTSLPTTVVRRYRQGPSPLVRDMQGGWRSGRLDAVLRGDFDLIAAN